MQLLRAGTLTCTHDKHMYINVLSSVLAVGTIMLLLQSAGKTRKMCVRRWHTVTSLNRKREKGGGHRNTTW